MSEIQLTRDAHKFYQTADAPLVRKLNRCFDQLRRNPHQHPNIKRLRGSLAGYWRYRAGDWRVVWMRTIISSPLSSLFTEARHTDEIHCQVNIRERLSIAFIAACR